MDAWRSHVDAPVSVEAIGGFRIREVDKRVFIFNRATGQTYRYFINRDDKGNAVAEGFAQMSFLELNDAAIMVPAPSAFDPTAFLAASPSPSKYDALLSAKPSSSPSVKPRIDFQPVASPSPAATAVPR